MNAMQGFARAYLRFVGIEYIALAVLGLAGLYGRIESLYITAAMGAYLLLVTPLHFVEHSGIRASCYVGPFYVKPDGGCNLASGEVHSALLTVTLLCILGLLGGAIAVWCGKRSWVVVSMVSAAVAIANCAFVNASRENPLIAAASMFWAVTYVGACIVAFHRRTKSA